MLKIYHNPRCSKSRAALAYLEEKGLKPEIRLYLKEPYTVEEMEDVLKRMNKEPQEIIRTQEKLFKSDYKNKMFNHDEWIKILLDSPELIQRPVVVSNNKAIFAVPVEEMEAIL